MNFSAKDESFWGFSLRTYAKPAVAEACLFLQDKRGLDVNLVLYCCWIGGRAPVLDTADFADAFEFSVRWKRHVVEPLRDVRRWMKTDGCEQEPVESKSCMSLRDRVKKLELEAEKLQQNALEALSSEVIGAGGEGPAAIAANLARLCEARGVHVDTRVHGALRTILRAAYPDADRDWKRLAAINGDDV